MSQIPNSISQEELIKIWLSKLTPSEQQASKEFIRKMRGWRGRKAS